MKTKIEFTKKNQTSHRRHLFNGLLMCMLSILMVVTGNIAASEI